MSRELSRNGMAGDLNEGLEVIREEFSPAISSFKIDGKKTTSTTEGVSEEGVKEEDTEPRPCGENCVCLDQNENLKNKLDLDVVEQLLKQKERELTAVFEKRLEDEISGLKDKCDYILLNEQIRATHMLREAHRERQEKITALQTQLECKNLAGLMYVVCTERRQSKLEKLRIIEDYKRYIHGLQDILTEAQELILHLSKGYKTAARIDHEWRNKMKMVLKEFQMFVTDFANGSDDTNQYFFDLPAILKTESPIVDNPDEDPCEVEEEQLCEEEEEPKRDNWWEQIDDDCRSFVMFGDMADFKPNQRREVLKTVKATKTAPVKWKKYVFHEMFKNSNCPNADDIKDEYPDRQNAGNWGCHLEFDKNYEQGSKTSFNSRRVTTASLDFRGNMGSILKMITSTNAGPPAEPKPNLLGARDSMEIASTTKLKEREKKPSTDRSKSSKVKINIANRRTSFFDEKMIQDENDTSPDCNSQQHLVADHSKGHDINEEEDGSVLGSIHNDSLLVIKGHKPDPDHKIHYEKNCPVAKCQRLHVDSFMRSLPPYMRANPFTHFEQSFDEYETCSPEQLAILKERLEKKKQGKVVEPDAAATFDEWKAVPGVGVQTSELSVSLPPCTCRAPLPTPVSSDGRLFDLLDLIPVKQAMDRIHEECFFDDNIQFDRFKVLGQESQTDLNDAAKRTGQSRLYEVKKILKVHPSLLDIFQANQQC